MNAVAERAPIPVTTIPGALERLARGLTIEQLSLPKFIRAAWPIIEPTRAFVPNWHIDLIAEYLTAVDMGQIKRLIINLPPRFGKSNLISVLWPAWSWTERPGIRWVFASYAASLSTKLSVDRRLLIESDWYQERWGAMFALAEDQNQKTEFSNTDRGTMIATSVGGSITGKGGDRIVIDDLLNPLDAESKAARDAANDFYARTLSTRLDNPKTGAIVVVMQRLHREDLTGYILEKETGWTHLKLPMAAEKQETVTFPVSGRQLTRAAGDLLCSERVGPDENRAMTVALGSRGAMAQLQQQPTSETGNFWKKFWWNFYQVPPAKFDAVIQSWDMSFTDSESSSFVVGQVWGMVGAKKYLLDQMREQLNYPDTKRALLAMVQKWPSAKAILVEDKANGPAIIADLRRTVSGMIPVSPIGDKIVRAAAVSPTIEAGDVWLPSPEIAPWIDAFIAEATAFPDAPNDDQVDAASQALSRLNELALVFVNAKETQRQVEAGDGGEEDVEGSVFGDGEGFAHD